MSGRTSTRSRAGAASKRAGADFEASLERYHKQLGPETHVYRVPHPVKRLGPVPGRPRGSRYIACDEATGPADFGGVDRGLALHFDAKRTKQARFPLGAIGPHLADHLTRHMCAGGHPFVLLQFTGGAKVQTFLIPWDRLCPLWTLHSKGQAKRGGASLTPGVAATLGYPVLGVCNWLPAFRAWVAE